MYLDAHLKVTGDMTTVGQSAGPVPLPYLFASAASPTSIPLRTERDLGTGKPIYARFHVTSAFTGGTGSTLKFFVAVSDNSGFTGLGTSTFILQYGPPLTGAFAAGLTVYVAVRPPSPFEGTLGRKFLAFGFEGYIPTNVWTAGKVDCDLVLDVQSEQKHYRGGFVVKNN